MAENRGYPQCDYGRAGRGIRDRFPHTAGNSFRNFEYNLMTGRLKRAGDNRYTHDKAGFRSIWNNRGNYTTYEYAPDYRLQAANLEDKGVRYSFKHNENGQRMAKYHNGKLAETYLWYDLTRLAGFHDGTNAYEFIYRKDERVPATMRRADGATAFLFYDQVGSLRVVADQSGDMIKEILYDPFGGILEDTNTALRIPLGFAGGLHDQGLGLVRFGWRDYDPNTGRWTAPDPMGDVGGDPDWYGYCLNAPVNMVDPLGLFIFGGLGVAGLATAAMGATGLIGYALAINQMGIAVANDLMDGSYGYANLAQDIAKTAWDQITSYPETVYNNTAAARKTMPKRAAQYRNARLEEQRKEQELADAEAAKARKSDERIREIADRETQKQNRKRAREFVKRAKEAIDNGDRDYGGSSSNIGARGGSYNGYGR